MSALFIMLQMVSVSLRYTGCLRRGVDFDLVGFWLILVSLSPSDRRRGIKPSE